MTTAEYLQYCDEQTAMFPAIHGIHPSTRAQMEAGKQFRMGEISLCKLVLPALHDLGWNVESASAWSRINSANFTAWKNAQTV